MAMDFKYGEHSIHESVVNIFGIWFKTISYGVNPRTGIIDMSEVLNIVIKHRPKLIIVGCTSYPKNQ